MKLLIDSHTFLWFVWDAPELSKTARDLIIDPDNDILLSMASIWELGIKASMNKLTLTEPYHTFLPKQLKENDIEILPILLAHALEVTTLPFHHKDPFDRLIAAQSLVEKIPIISIDAVLDSYSVQRLW